MRWLIRRSASNWPLTSKASKWMAKPPVNKTRTGTMTNSVPLCRQIFGGALVMPVSVHSGNVGLRVGNALLNNQPPPAVNLCKNEKLRTDPLGVRVCRVDTT
jgi:hypothetical protein